MWACLEAEVGIDAVDPRAAGIDDDIGSDALRTAIERVGEQESAVSVSPDTGMVQCQRGGVVGDAVEQQFETRRSAWVILPS